MADDQSPFSLSCYGTTACETPTLDALAKQGLVLDDARHMGSWSGAVCLPSRTMIMTGRNVWRIPGASGPGLERSPGFRIAAAEQSLAAVFNRAGYVTFRTCKKGNSFAEANQQFQTNREKTSRDGNAESGSQWHADQVLEFLNRRQPDNDPPFLIYLGFSHPHDPRNALPELAAKYGAHNDGPPSMIDPRSPSLPKNYLTKHPFNNSDLNVRDEKAVQGVMDRRDEVTIRNELGREFACIENMDRQIGRVLESLKQKGELDNTYIIYTADHGIAVGSHGLMGKQNLYEHTWRVPFIIRGPGIQGGRHADGSVYLMDILPTLCDLAHVEVPAQVDGLSFRPVLEGNKNRIRDTMYGVYCGGKKPGIRSIKTADGWKLIVYRVGDEPMVTQLFHLGENPEEWLPDHHQSELIQKLGIAPKPSQTNLAMDPQHQTRLSEMIELLKREMTTQGDPYMTDFFGE
jgi:arylsulfatase A-like enzyme